MVSLNSNYNEKLFLVFGYDHTDEEFTVEGCFTDEGTARDVARIADRRIQVCPLEKNTVLPDRKDWPGAYYVYPDGTVHVPLDEEYDDEDEDEEAGDQFATTS